MNKLIEAYHKYKKYLYIVLFILVVIFVYFTQLIQSVKQKTTAPLTPLIPLTSPTVTPTTEPGEFKEQAQNEIIFNEAWDKLQKEYPWYKNLPIIKDGYTIVYDFDKKSFRIRLTSKNISSEERNVLVNSALDQLKKIKVDLKINTYYIIED